MLSRILVLIYLPLFLQAGITAAPVRAVAAVKNFSPSVPNLSNINLPSIPTSIKDLKTALPNFNKKY